MKLCACLKAAKPQTNVARYVEAKQPKVARKIARVLAEYRKAIAKQVAALYEKRVQKADWTEEDHPRDESGKFTSVGSATLSSADKDRLTALRVPPAWTNVRLNNDPNAALQVIGVDSKGRSQYIYSAEHAEKAAAAKFERQRAYNKVANKVSSQAKRDMTDTSQSQSARDTAAVTYLISQTGFRVGSDEDTGAAVKAFGASNLLKDHVSVQGDKLHFDFTGKKGVAQTHDVEDATLAAYVATRMKDTGTQRLFATDDAKVRAYFHRIAGDAFKVKDMRTHIATIEALRMVNSLPTPTSKSAATKMRAAVGDRVAAKLGNTRAMALNSYIHPAVFSKWGFQHAAH